MSVKCFEQVIEFAGGKEIFLQIWKPEKYENTLIITHGLAEHSDCYSDLAIRICKELGWGVICWDMQGHGRSTGKRGFVLHFDEFIEDFSHVLNFVKKNKLCSEKPVLFGHSTGGLVTLRHYLKEKPSIKGVCLNAPAFGLSIEVPKLKLKLAKLANTYFPNLTLHNEIAYENLVHDKKIVEEFRSDPLRHDKISSRLFFGMLEGFKIVKKGASQIEVPLLLQVAGKDRCVSTKAAMEVFHQIKDKRKKSYLYSKSYHNIFRDLEQEQAFSDLKSFLNELS